jgi:hypothetical protein
MHQYMKKILTECNYSEFKTNVNTRKAKNKIFKSFSETLKKKRMKIEENIHNS